MPVRQRITTDMEGKKSNWLARLDAVTKQMKDAERLSSTMLNTKPDAQTWSVGDVVDHLVRINTSYYPGFKAIHEKNQSLKRINRIGWLNRWFGQLILKSVQPDRKRKSKTMTIWEPASSDHPPSVFVTFYAEQELLKNWIHLLANEKSKRAVIPSPANARIAYPLETALEIIITHEERHMVQIGEIMRRLKKYEAT